MELENKQELLAQQVASGKTIVEGCQAIGLSPSTAYNWTGTKAFKQRVSAIRTSCLDRVVGALGDGATGAVATLREIADNKEAKDSDRIAAAKALLALVNPFSELCEMRQRLDDLEARQMRVAG